MGQRISLTIVTFLNKFDCHKRKKVCDEHIRHTHFCGKGGIRTPGASQHGGFGGELSFKSGAKVRQVFESCKFSSFFLHKKYKKRIFAHRKS